MGSFLHIEPLNDNVDVQVALVKDDALPSLAHHHFEILVVHVAQLLVQLGHLEERHGCYLSQMIVESLRFKNTKLEVNVPEEISFGDP